MGASLVTQLVKNPPSMRETPISSICVRKIPWGRDRLPTPVFLGFLVAQMVKNPPAMRETWFDPWVGKPLQYSCLENPMDRGAWQAIVH